MAILGPASAMIAAAATALRTAPDHSTAFTTRVAALATVFAERCSLQLEHDKSMSYAASQAISWEEDQRGRRLKFRVFISARGPLWTFVVYLGEKRREWRRQADGPGSEHLDCVRAILDADGLSFVPASDLAAPAQGFVTEMDGVPASLFEVLFSELA